MNRQIEPWVDEALRALAAADAQAIVPAHVEAAVMKAWDERPRRSGGWADRRPWWRAAALVAGAAVLVVVAVLLRGVPPGAGTGDIPAPEVGYVLVPDPMADPAALQIMRLRMPRAGLANLGVPLVNPDADGLVDVELLVGDDGVARAIRRATLVATGGGER